MEHLITSAKSWEENDHLPYRWHLPYRGHLTCVYGIVNKSSIHTDIIVVHISASYICVCVVFCDGDSIWRAVDGVSGTRCVAELPVHRHRH